MDLKFFFFSSFGSFVVKKKIHNFSAEKGFFFFINAESSLYEGRKIQHHGKINKSERTQSGGKKKNEQIESKGSTTLINFTYCCHFFFFYYFSLRSWEEYLPRGVCTTARDVFIIGIVRL